MGKEASLSVSRRRSRLGTAGAAATLRNLNHPDINSGNSDITVTSSEKRNALKRNLNTNKLPPLSLTADMSDEHGGRNPKRKASVMANVPSTREKENLLQDVAKPISPEEIEEWEGWIELESEPVSMLNSVAVTQIIANMLSWAFQL
jgi:hypothetical protein